MRLHPRTALPALNVPALSVAAALLVAACGEREPDPSSHDTRYRAVSGVGEVQDPAAAPGTCVLDTATGLTWEVKTTDGGLRDAAHTYTWFVPDESHDGELDYRGTPDGGDCAGSACDTSGLLAAVNASGLCGHTDWRMPSRDELGSLSDPRRTGAPPTINTRHFPATRPAEYWSGNDYQFQHDAAWVWSFHNGMDRVEWKKTPRHVRLVRGEPGQAPRIPD